MFVLLTLCALLCVSAQAAPCGPETGLLCAGDKQEDGQVTLGLKLLQDVPKSEQKLPLASAFLKECDGDCNDLNVDLIDAAASGNATRVKELLSQGADARRSLALHVAAQGGYLDVVEILIDAGADVNAGFPSGTSIPAGSTPLILAAARGHLDVVKLLIKEGADVDILAGPGLSALHETAIFGHVDVAQALIDAGADVDVRGRTTKVTPLMMAAMASGLRIPSGLKVPSGTKIPSGLKMVQFLLDNGADVDIQDVDGNTALILASIVGDDAVAKALLEAGASPSIRDNAGLKASDVICACADGTASFTCARGKCGGGENESLAKMLKNSSISKSPKAALLVSCAICLILL